MTAQKIATASTRPQPLLLTVDWIALAVLIFYFGVVFPALHALGAL